MSNEQEGESITKDDPSSESGNVQKHVRNTFKMVCELSEKEPHIASWSSDGAAFTVRDKGLFVQKLSEYGFGMKTIDNFVKQQNNYAFERVYNEKELRGGFDANSGIANTVTFRHQFFHRDHPERLGKITSKNRTSAKNKSQDTSTVEHLPKEVEDLRRQISLLKAAPWKTNTSNAFLVC